MINEITFEIIQKCLNNCIYCSSNSNSYSSHITEFNIFKKVLDEAVELGLKRLCVSGGEPFLHPEIIPMIRYAKSKGIEVFVYSCGIVEYDSKVFSIPENILQALSEIKLNKVIFNLPASNEILYNRITGTQNRFRLLKDSMHSAFNAGLYTEAHFVPTKINIGDIESTVNLAKKLNVKQVSFLRLVVQERAFKNREMLMLSELEEHELKNVLKSIQVCHNDIKIRIGIPFSEKHESRKCRAGLGKLIIRYDGAVLPCEAYKYIKCINNGHEIKPDNINNHSLREIYFNSEFLNTFRQEIKAFQTEDNSCEVCPAQARIKFLLG